MNRSSEVGAAVRFVLAPGVLLLVLLAAANPVEAGQIAEDSTRRVEGVVTSNGVGVEGVEVRTIDGIVLTTTDSAGAFVLPLTDSSVRLTFNRTGFQESKVRVSPSLGVRRIEVELEPLRRVGETITVTARRELNTIQEEASIARIEREELAVSPSFGAAEAIDQVPGVSILRDAGEADEVFIRGMEPRLTSTMIDGERIPGTDGDDRTASVSLIPLGLLEYIEVQTTFSPEMDADVIGGSVNLLTRKAPRDGIGAFRLGIGHEQESGGLRGDAGMVVGRRYLDDRLGVVVSIDGDGGDQGVDQVEREWDEGSLERLELRSLAIDRHRVGGLVRIDYSPSVRSDLSAKLLVTELGEDELRRRASFDAEALEVSRDFRRTSADKRVTSIGVAGAHMFRTPIRLGYQLGVVRSKEDAPEQIDTLFVFEDVELDEALVPVEEKIGDFVLDEISIERHEAVDENLIGGLDVAVPWTLRGDPAEIRIGLKIRTKDKRQLTRRTVFESEDDVFLLEFIDRSFEDTIVGGLRPLGVVPDRDAAAEIIRRFELEGERDVAEEAADYDATEDSIAIYGLMEGDVATDATLLVGIRYERTEHRYDGFLLTTVEEDGEEAPALEPVTGAKTYDFLMPAALLVVKLGPSSKLRAGLSRTFARPDYIQLVPSAQIDQDDREIERGNPDLRVTSSWNLDLVWDWEGRSGTALHVAPYYKQIDDFVFESRSELLFNDEEFLLIEPRNGDDARVYGVDLGLRHDFPTGGSPWGLFFDVGLSWSESRARIPEREGGSIPFPGHAEWVGDLVLGLSSDRLDARLRGTFVDSLLLEVGESSSADLYAGEHFRLDLYVGIPVRSAWELYLKGSNLTDEDVNLYEGSSETPTLDERFGRAVLLGIRFSI